MTVAVRTVSEGFAATAICTVPPPLPAPFLIVTHSWSDTAFHAHWFPAATVTELEPPAAPNESDEGDTRYSQPGRSPAWATVNVRSPTLIVPVRGETSRFRSTEYATVPLPMPGLPLVTATQDALLVAVHPQWAGAVTEKAPVTLSLLYEALVGE